MLAAGFVSVVQVYQPKVNPTPVENSHEVRSRMRVVSRSEGKVFGILAYVGVNSVSEQ